MHTSWNRESDHKGYDACAYESPPGDERREIVEVTLLLLALLVVFFWPAVVGGRVLLPTDLIFDVDPLWRPLAPEGYTQPSNQLLSDQVYQFLPWKAFALRSLAQGHLPLWNPYSNGGQPFVGNAQSAVFSPFNLVGYLVPLYASYIVTAILRLSVAGVFTFLFAREIGLGKPGALLSTIAFTFSGPMMVWLGHPHSFVIVWLPAMLLTIERALARRSWLYVIASGLTIGAQFLGGHPETSFHTMLAWGVYALYRTVALEGWRPARLLSQFLRVASAVMVGTLLAAVQLLPFVEALLHSATLVARQAQATEQASSLATRILTEWHQWPTAITAILPQYFGAPLDNSYWFPYSNYAEQNAYVGILPLVLGAAITIHSVQHRSPSRRNVVLPFAFFAVLCLGIAIRLPILNVVNYLPLFSIAANGRMRLIYAFVVAILAGFGLDAIRGRHAEECRRTALRVAFLLVLIGLVFVALAFAGFILLKDEVIRSGRADMETRWGTPGFSRPLQYYYALVEERYEKKLALFLPANIVMYLPVLIALTWLVLHRLGRRLRPDAGLWTYAALGLTVLDLFVVGIPFHPTTTPDYIFPPVDRIQFLQQDSDTYRVCGLGLALNPNSGMVFGISDARGYDPIAPRRYMSLVQRIEGHVQIHSHSLFMQADSPLLDLLDVKYMLSEQELGGRWELARRSAGGVDVYRNQNVLPRAFIVHRIEVVDSPAESLDRITDPAFDFREIVVLEERPTDWIEPTQKPPANATVRIVAYRPNRVNIEVKTAAKGLLVLTDTFMPGWKAFLDGQATHVYVADHAFRSMLVPAGTHRVEFVYRPLSFWIAVGISLLAMLTVLSAWLLICIRRPRESVNENSQDG